MRPIILVAVAALSARAQTAPPHDSLATRAELDSITQRGIDLYEYDRAAWEATDALLKLHPKPHPGAQYIVYHTPFAWIVRFGQLSAMRDTFFTVADASKVPRDTAYIAQETPFRLPYTDDYFVHAARALETAEKAFGLVQPRPYNHAVIPASNGEWLVYLYPAQTTANYWPLGGDERFHISSDGLRIIERHRMHQTVRDVPNGGPPTDSAGNRRVANFQVNILDNRPEDSDVFAVLSREPSLPAIVGVMEAQWAYEIYRDGRISLPKNMKR